MQKCTHVHTHEHVSLRVNEIFVYRFTKKEYKVATNICLVNSHRSLFILYTPTYARAHPSIQTDRQTHTHTHTHTHPDRQTDRHTHPHTHTHTHTNSYIFFVGENVNKTTTTFLRVRLFGFFLVHVAARRIAVTQNAQWSASWAKTPENGTTCIHRSAYQRQTLVFA